MKLPIKLICRDRGSCLEVVPAQLLGNMLWSLHPDCSLACCEPFGLLFIISSADALALLLFLPWAPVHTPMLLLCEYKASSDPWYSSVYSLSAPDQFWFSSGCFPGRSRQSCMFLVKENVFKTTHRAEVLSI